MPSPLFQFLTISPSMSAETATGAAACGERAIFRLDAHSIEIPAFPPLIALPAPQPASGYSFPQVEEPTLRSEIISPEHRSLKAEAIMRLGKSALLAAALLGATAFSADAQTPQWPPIQSYPSNPPASTPQSWSYDPYTSGSTACPQTNWGNSPTCREILQPTAGQPNYNPTR